MALSIYYFYNMTKKKIVFWLEFILSIAFMCFAFLRATDIIYPIKFGRPANPEVITKEVKSGNLSLKEASFYVRTKK